MTGAEYIDLETDLFDMNDFKKFKSSVPQINLILSKHYMQTDIEENIILRDVQKMGALCTDVIKVVVPEKISNDFVSKIK